MPASAEEIEHACDLFADLGVISTGRMFSGTALYVEGDVMFACLLGGTIWMKSDDTTGLHIGKHIFVEDKGAYYERPTDAPAIEKW